MQLIGVSVDSIYSHIAWVRDIEQHAAIDVKFPVVADLDQRVARLYGMVHEATADTATVRAVFVIDPKQKVRTVLYYPMQLGRSIDELAARRPWTADGRREWRELPGRLEAG